MKRTIAFLFLLTGLACSSPTASEPDPTLPDPAIGVSFTRSVFDGEHIYFGSENRRSADTTVSFPEANYNYESIQLNFALRCPSLGRCDAWDRKGWLAVVQNPDTEEETVLEIWRFITPYGIGADWQYDFTDLRPLLSGEVTLRVFIDTWVGPGHQSGDGWLVDLSLDFKGGIPTHQPIAVIPVWTSHSFEYGNPTHSTSPAASATFAIPADTKAATLRTLVTGHGQGNAQNCAEFCSKTHTISVGDQTFDQQLWRDDCEETAVPNQLGNWKYPRAGWCPGAYVVPWVEDVYAGLSPGGESSILYSVEPYENSCRPDSPNCTGCVFGTTCDYNSGNHTKPIFVLSGLLTLYR